MLGRFLQPLFNVFSRVPLCKGEEHMKALRRTFLIAMCILVASTAHAQVQTGSILGVVTDASGAVLPGATISLVGDKLIGGVQTQTASTSFSVRSISV